MKFEEMPTKDLLALHNRIADKPAGTKTFSTRAKLIARIEQVADAKKVDLSSPRQPPKPEATRKPAQPRVEATGATEAPEKQSRGKGIGTLARTILMDPAGYPHVLVAAMVNAQIEGATATAKSVRWYANDMRKKGTTLPPRQKIYPSDMSGEQAAEVLSTMTVVEPAPSGG